MLEGGAPEAVWHLSKWAYFIMYIRHHPGSPASPKVTKSPEVVAGFAPERG